MFEVKHHHNNVLLTRRQKRTFLAEKISCFICKKKDVSKTINKMKDEHAVNKLFKSEENFSVDLSPLFLGQSSVLRLNDKDYDCTVVQND